MDRRMKKSEPKATYCNETQAERQRQVTTRANIVSISLKSHRGTPPHADTIFFTEVFMWKQPKREGVGGVGGNAVSEKRRLRRGAADGGRRLHVGRSAG